MSQFQATVKAKTAKRIKSVNIRQFALIFILIGLIVVFSLATNSFLTLDNIMNVLRQVSMICIVAVGMTMVIILGDIDLSPGSMMAFVGVMAATVFKVTESPVLVVISALAIGAVVGFLNGFITAKGGIPAFITTLATMQIFRGIAFIYTGGNPVSVFDERFTQFGTGYVGIIPFPVIIMIIIIAFGVFITNYTRFGRHIYAVGGNLKASKWSGINVVNVKIGVFTIIGTLTGLAGLIAAARLGSGQPSAAQGFEMDVITAVILGGASLSGGRGKMSSTVIGVIIIGILANGLTLMNISTYWQQVIKGIIIVVAVLIDTNSKKKYS
jgi:ribose transport system permease protein